MAIAHNTIRAAMAQRETVMVVAQRAVQVVMVQREYCDSAKRNAIVVKAQSDCW